MNSLPKEADKTKNNAARLKELQIMPLEWKVMLTQERVREFYEHFDGAVYVSFSGGKDSTVLLNLVREVFPDAPAVFFNTGLEYPEIREFAMGHENVEEVRPRWGRRAKTRGKNPNDVLTFLDVVNIYGYPLVSKEVAGSIAEARHLQGGVGWQKLHRQYKHSGDSGERMYDRSKYLPLFGLPLKISSKCCAALKKGPAGIYGRAKKRHPIIASMTEESDHRKTAWVKQGGCNAFDGKAPHSNPMAFWTEQDVLKYVVETGIEICSVYGDIACEDEDGFEYNAKEMIQSTTTKLRCTGCNRTGCIFCAFGAHLEKGETRFQRLAKTHPRQYEYCIGGGEWRANDKYDPTLVGTECWNPKEIWTPNRKGLGMGKVFDMMNGIYGKNFIRYE